MLADAELIAVAGELLAESALNSRRGGRVLGNGANQIVGAVEDGTESQKFARRTIRLRRN